MDPDSAIQLGALVILIILSGFFSSAETAFTTVSKHKLTAMLEEGNKRAGRVLEIIEDSSKLLSTILIGNNIVNIGASALATVLATRLWGNAFIGVMSGILTIVILIFGEITPKTIAKQNNVKLSLIYIDVIRGLMWFLTPVIWIINAVCKLILRLIGVDPEKTETLTEGELITIVNASHEDGVIEEEEKEMITNVVDFGDALVKDVMIPRVDMVLCPVDIPFNELLELIMEKQYTRIPIYEESVDNVTGILNIKDFFFLYAEKKGEEFDIRDILRDPFFTFEMQKTSDLMAEMRKDSQSIAIVLDEYGVTAGLVTMEDLVEEIVGEIKDEYDDEERETLREVGENIYEADGSMKLEDLNDALELDIHSEDYDSVGGHMIEMLEHLPEEGDTVTEGNVTFTVTSMDKNRTETILIEIKPEEPKEEASEEEDKKDD
ncbi:MAG: HlyC/CorC family transporter [Lachnospiraceae bacterium]|nr:HlyC/CorC family transporter [Lachnospiraceae bacterium]